MSDPSISRTKALPFRIELSSDASTNRQNLEGMIERFQQTHRTETAQARFEFRMKTVGTGTNQRSFLELREQTGFGKFREAIGSRSGGRSSERQNALIALSQTLGEEFISQIAERSQATLSGGPSPLASGLPAIDRDMAHSIRKLVFDWTVDGRPQVELYDAKPQSIFSLDSIMAAFKEPEASPSTASDQKPAQP